MSKNITSQLQLVSKSLLESKQIIEFLDLKIERKSLNYLNSIAQKILRIIFLQCGE